MSNCQVRNCKQTADARHVYDCGPESQDQTMEICNEHYESFDVLQDGTKDYFFKKFERAEKREDLVN